MNHESIDTLIPAEGMYNLRDLGGFAAAGGKKVRQGAVYRSDDLSALTASGLKTLADRNIRTVIDFRGDEEVRHAPNRLPATVTNEIRLAIEPGNMMHLSEFPAAFGPAEMCELYRNLARKTPVFYAGFFRLLSTPGNAPLLFHCSAGKDRTGAAAALLLSALGVSQEDIFADYLRSAEPARKKYRAYIARNSAFEAAFTVASSYLEAFFETIDRDFGGVTEFLTRNLGADLGQLRSLYTE